MLLATPIFPPCLRACVVSFPFPYGTLVSQNEKPARTFADVSQAVLLLEAVSKLLDAYYRSILSSGS